MSRIPSTDFEHSSEIPTWIVLICSGLALVMFFGWIVKDLSVSPDQAKNELVQPLSETGSVSNTLDNSARAVELADSQAINLALSGSNLSLKAETGNAELKGSSDLASARESTAQSTQRIAAQTSVEALQSGPSSTGQVRQSARQKDAERISKQQHVTELPATDRKSQRGVEVEGKNTAYAFGSQPQTTQAHPDTSAEAPADSVPTESSRTVPIQEAVASAEQFSAAEPGPVKELPGQFKGVVSSPNSTVQPNTVEPATGSSLDTTPRQDQSPSADWGALRQLLAEAAAFNETDNEQVREQHDELESLSVLSAAIQFAPGSKVASESVTSTVNQIQRILAHYPETRINVIVATNESGNQKQDLLLSQERGRTLIARLVNSGLAFSRFSLKALTDDQLPANTHRVEIQAHSKS